MADLRQMQHRVPTLNALVILLLLASSTCLRFFVKGGFHVGTTAEYLDCSRSAQ